MEQDKYKPSVETVLSILEGFETDIDWLITGARKSADKAFEVIRVNEKEAELLMLFDKLKVADQDEIIEFIKLKINRY